MSDKQDLQIYACAALISLQHVNLLDAPTKAAKAFEIAAAMCAEQEAAVMPENDADGDEDDQKSFTDSEVEELEEKAFAEGKERGRTELLREQELAAAEAAKKKPLEGKPVDPPKQS